MIPVCLVIGLVVWSGYSGSADGQIRNQAVVSSSDPDFHEIDQRLEALERAISRFSAEHGNIITDQGKANSDLAQTKTRVEIISKQLDEVISSGTPIDSKLIAVLDTKLNMLLWLFGSAGAALIGLEVTRVFGKRK